MVYNELYHHGVKGMKWGVRRYQNSDGSLTPKGRKRAERDMSELSNNKRKQYRPDANKWVKEDLNRSKRLVSKWSKGMEAPNPGIQDTESIVGLKPLLYIGSAFVS